MCQLCWLARPPTSRVLCVVSWCLCGNLFLVVTACSNVHNCRCTSWLVFVASPATTLLQAAADKDRRYVVHAVNRYAEIFLAYSNGSLVSSGLGNTRVSLQSMMHVTTVASVSSLVASEPVSWGGCWGMCAAWRREWLGYCVALDQTTASLHLLLSDSRVWRCGCSNCSSNPAWCSGCCPKAAPHRAHRGRQ